MEENKIHFLAAEPVTGLERLRGRVDQAQIDDLDIGPGEHFRDPGEVAIKAFLEPFKLGPVGVQADAEKSDAERFHEF